RHFRLPGFGIENQWRLRESAVIIVGMGGLGSVVAGQLAAAGIGRLTLVDFDTITLSNLSRQLLYTETDLGQYKTAVATERLQKQFANTLFSQALSTFDSTTGEKLCSGHHLIMDCCDTRAAKYSIDDVAASMRIPVVSGAVSRFDGQVSVFHGHCSTSYAHVFPKEQDLQDEGCDALGVWAPAVGI
ncbi:MAG: HesA/MoeB/ThiF family protein, partial [Flavobacteriales bacterium]